MFSPSLDHELQVVVVSANHLPDGRVLFSLLLKKETLSGGVIVAGEKEVEETSDAP